MTQYRFPKIALRAKAFSCASRHLFLSFLALGGFAFASTAGAGAGAAAPTPLRIAAASSLRHVLPELIKQRPTDGVPVVITYGASGTLFQQIVHGAPFDIFMSADSQAPQALAQRLQLSQPAQPYANGRLALIGKPKFAGLAGPVSRILRTWLTESPAAVTNAKLAIANPKHAPYGQMASDYLQKEGLLEALTPQLVFGENVSQTVQFVVTGNADWALGAMSLVAGMQTNSATQRLAVYPIDSEKIQPLTHSLIVIKPSSDTEKWVSFIRSQAVSPVWEKYGFLPSSL